MTVLARGGVLEQRHRRHTRLTSGARGKSPVVAGTSDESRSRITNIELPWCSP